MVCDICQGRHYLLVGGQYLLCPRCGGFGEIHCCEGEQAQPYLEPMPPEKGDASAL